MGKSALSPSSFATSSEGTATNHPTSSRDAQVIIRSKTGLGNPVILAICERFVAIPRESASTPLTGQEAAKVTNAHHVP